MNGQHPQTDFELVQSAKSGNESAFHELVAKYYGRAYFTAYGRLGDADFAEDAAQDAFVAAYLGLDKLADAGLFSAWLISIVKNLCKNRIRTHQRREKVLESLYGEIAGMGVLDSAAKGESPFEAAEQREKLTQLYEAVNRLEPDLREMILLRFAEDMNNTEIGKLLGIPHYTVGRRLEKACELMKGFLQGEELTCLAKLRPSKDAVAKTIAVTGAVSLMSAGSRAAILSALGDIVPAGVVKAAGGVGIVPAALNNVAGFLKTGAGKFFVLTCFTGLVILGAKNLTERSEKIKLQNQVEAARLAEITGKGGAGRSGSAGQSNRKKGGTGSSKIAADSLVRTNRKALKQDAITAAKNIELTCPLVMVTGIVTVGGGITDDSLYVELWQNGKTLGDEVVENRRMAREKVGSDGSYRVFAPDGSGLHLEVVGSAPMEWSMPPRDELQTTAPVRFLVQDFALPETDILKGRVVMAESGAAAAGAKVRLYNQATLNENWTYKMQSAVADAKGDFQFDHGVLKGLSRVGAVTTGTAPTLKYVSGRDFEVGVQLSLEKGTGKVSGNAMLMPGNSPLSGARLHATSAGSLGLRDDINLVLDRDGKFEISNLGEEKLKVVLLDEAGRNYGNAEGVQDYWMVESLNDKHTTLTMKVQSGNFFRGKVLTLNDEKPIIGAKVFSKDESEFVLSNSAGEFEISNVFVSSNGMANLTATADGYQFYTNDYFSGDEKTSKTVNLKKPLNFHKPINIIMAKNTLVSGRITDMNGEPLPLIHLMYNNESSPIEFAKKTLTDESGYFRFYAPANRKIKLMVKEDGYANYDGAYVDVKDTPLQLDPIVLPDEIVISGSVTDLNGDRLSGEPIFNVGPLADMARIGSRSLKPDVKFDGINYELRGLPAGNVGMVVAGKGHFVPERKILHLTSGTQIQNLNFRLARYPLISGRLLDENGQLIQGKLVPLKPKGDRWKIQNGLFSAVLQPHDRDVDFEFKNEKTGDVYFTTAYVGKDDQYLELKLKKEKRADYAFAFYDKKTKEPIIDISPDSPLQRESVDSLMSNKVLYKNVGGDNINFSIRIYGYRRNFSFKRSELSITKYNDIFISDIASVQARFVDAVTKKPVGEVKVKSRYRDSYGKIIEADETTHSNGVYRSADIVYGEDEKYDNIELIIEPPSPYAKLHVRSQYGKLPGETNWGDIELGKELDGKLILQDKNGKPQEKIRISWDCEHSIFNEDFGFEMMQSNITNKEGMVEFKKIPSGKHTVSYRMNQAVRVQRIVPFLPDITGPIVLKEGRVRVIVMVDKSMLVKNEQFSFEFYKKDGTESYYLDSALVGDLSLNLDPGEWKFITRISTQVGPDGAYTHTNTLDSKSITIPDVKEFIVKSVLN